MVIFGLDFALDGGTDGSMKTAAFTAESGKMYLVDTATTGAVTVTPPDAQYGSHFAVLDAVANAATANITVDVSGDKFHGAAADDVLAADMEVGIYYYVDATTGWIRVNGI